MWIAPSCSWWRVDCRGARTKQDTWLAHVAQMLGIILFIQEQSLLSLASWGSLLQERTASWDALVQSSATPCPCIVSEKDGPWQMFTLSPDFPCLIVVLAGWLAILDNLCLGESNCHVFSSLKKKNKNKNTVKYVCVCGVSLHSMFFYETFFLSKVSRVTTTVLSQYQKPEWF